MHCKSNYATLNKKVIKQHLIKSKKYVAYYKNKNHIEKGRLIALIQYILDTRGFMEQDKTSSSANEDTQQPWHPIEYSDKKNIQRERQNDKNVKSSFLWRHSYIGSIVIFILIACFLWYALMFFFQHDGLRIFAACELDPMRRHTNIHDLYQITH